MNKKLRKLKTHGGDVIAQMVYEAPNANYDNIIGNSFSINKHVNMLVAIDTPIGIRIDLIKNSFI